MSSWFVRVRGEWVNARPYQAEAARYFLQNRQPRQSVPHPDGGLFEVTFTSAVRHTEGSVCIEYKNIRGERFEMMHCAPIYAERANRLMSPP